MIAGAKCLIVQSLNVPVNTTSAEGRENRRGHQLGTVWSRPVITPHGITVRHIREIRKQKSYNKYQHQYQEKLPNHLAEIGSSKATFFLNSIIKSKTLNYSSDVRAALLKATMIHIYSEA